jgi:hypothetical protein
MMIWAILANSTANAGFQPITRFPGQLDLINWCQEMAIGTALLFTLLGFVYLLYGYSNYKWLITVNAAIVGLYVGVAVGHHYGHSMLGGGLGGIFAASVTFPLMKWSVSIIGGICGALVGAGVWNAVGLEPNFAWAGAMTGLVGFGMFSFILFRGSIIMYTSLQGAMMLIIGLLALAFKYQDMGVKLSQTMTGQPFVLPIAVFVPAILGLIYQQTHGSAPAGGPGGGGDKKK